MMGAKDKRCNVNTVYSMIRVGNKFCNNFDVMGNSHYIKTA